jgi:hypothetical protein
MIANRIRKDGPKADSPGSLTLDYRTTDGALRLGNDKIVSDKIALVFQLTASSVSEQVFIADGDFELVSVERAFRVASTSGTLDVEKLTGTTAPGSGTSMLTGTVSLAGAANTVVAGTVHGTQATRRVTDGDRIGLKIGGTMTNLAGCAVVVTLKRV